MKIKLIALVALLALSLSGLSACDGGGTWADVVGIAGCENGKPAGPGIKTAEDLKIIGQAICADRQKNYAGDFQCNGTTLQVKCK